MLGHRVLQNNGGRPVGLDIGIDESFLNHIFRITLS